MKKKLKYIYFVEGEDEKHLIDTLKSDMQCIQPGKSIVFNVIQKRFTKLMVRNFPMDMVAILVFDTDVEINLKILNDNIEFLRKQKCVKNIICIPQVKNLEDELLKACEIKDIRNLTDSKSLSNYKNDIITCRNLDARLHKCGFDLSKFWNSEPTNCFSKFKNEATKIKYK